MNLGLTRTCFLSMLLCCCTGVFAQAEVDHAAPASIVLRPTIPAYFPGCTNEAEGSEEKLNCSAGKLMSYITNNLRYPDLAREDKIEGVVVLSFVVTDSGRIQDVRILRDIGSGCGEEAKRVLTEMPIWQPAIFKGDNVFTQFTIPITFSLKSGMFDYVLHIGNLDDGEVRRDELLEAVTSVSPRVTNPKGVELVVTEVVFTFERGGERREYITRGAESPPEKDFAKWLGKKPGRLTVEANVVEGLDIRAVSKGFVVVK